MKKYQPNAFLPQPNKDFDKHIVTQREAMQICWVTCIIHITHKFTEHLAIMNTDVKTTTPISTHCDAVKGY